MRIDLAIQCQSIAFVAIKLQAIGTGQPHAVRGEVEGIHRAVVAHARHRFEMIAGGIEPQQTAVAGVPEHTVLQGQLAAPARLFISRQDRRRRDRQRFLVDAEQTFAEAAGVQLAIRPEFHFERMRHAMSGTGYAVELAIGIAEQAALHRNPQALLCVLGHAHHIAAHIGKHMLGLASGGIEFVHATVAPADPDAPVTAACHRVGDGIAQALVVLGHVREATYAIPAGREIGHAAVEQGDP